jgi:hypothetical protein
MSAHPQQARTARAIPLLFFRNCLHADNARLPDIIRAETKGRRRFIARDGRAGRVATPDAKWIGEREHLALEKN